MEEKLQGIPDRERELIPRFVEALAACHGGSLRSVVLYGSAASGDYRPGHSDLNFLVMIEPLSAERLRGATACEKTWKKQLPINALYVPADFVRESADVFPIELLDMSQRHIALYGDDPFKDVEISGANLRLQVEHELKGKLIRLRQSYVRDSQSPASEKAIIALMLGSLSSFITLFAAMLRLKGLEPPGTQTEVIESAVQEFGLDGDSLKKVLAAKSRSGTIPPAAAHQVFGQYLEQIHRAVEVVDEMRVRGWRTDRG